MCLDNCLFRNSKKPEIYSTNLFKININTKSEIKLFKSQIRYKLFTQHPTISTSFHTIFINSLFTDNNNHPRYLGTFITNTEFISLSFRFVILDTSIIDSRTYYRILVELDNENDRVDSFYWYILSTSSL